MAASGLRLSAFAAALMLSACSGQSPQLLGDASIAPDPSARQTQQASADPKIAMTELQKATSYWGQQYAKQPNNLEYAMSYAKNLKAMGEKRKALSVLQNASRVHSTNPELASEYGRLALEFDQISVAEKLLAIADQPTKPDWRVISARGTVHAKRGQYSEAIPYFQRALVLAPNRASVINNLAMAYAMKGDAAQAESLLRQASTKPGESEKIRQNLALVLGLQGRYDEARSTAIASAQSDTDVIRQVVRIEPKSSAPAFKPAFASATTQPAANSWGATVAVNAPGTGAPAAAAPGLRGPAR